jgi:UDP-galactopyranose mutase
MTRFARVMRVFFVEEWVATDAPEPHLDMYPTDVGVTLAVPRLPRGLEGPAALDAQRVLIDRLWAEQRIVDPIVWYYTPMSGTFSDHLEAEAIVYDCMDELSGFMDCPPEMIARESELFDRADLVFTGGYSLYEAKRSRHRSVHAFPSSVDVEHFRRARAGLADPPDQKDIPHPRFGFYGVIEERLDLALLAAIAAARPDWQFVIVGPVVRIDPSTLPQGPNIHYLGGKRYEELPAYLAGWDVAMMPFALNKSTRFISPTKTPEFLAAGRPVISTPIRDVVRTYGDEGSGLVAIAATPEEFVAAGEGILAESGRRRREWLAAVDRTLAGLSWDATWSRMMDLIERTSRRVHHRPNLSTAESRQELR